MVEQTPDSKFKDFQLELITGEAHDHIADFGLLYLRTESIPSQRSKI